MESSQLADSDQVPDGISSLLDTDLYKLTMQCAVLKYFPEVDVSYTFTNRTPSMRFTKEAFDWLSDQVYNNLKKLTLSKEESEYLHKTCPYFNQQYLDYLSRFRFDPQTQVKLEWIPGTSVASDQNAQEGELHMNVNGRWVDTILYEIPLLALTSEAYFRFCDRDWSHNGQLEKAYKKGISLLQHGCFFSEFGTRRRRDYKTQDLVIKGLCQAAQRAESEGWKGQLSGTSNVHFAHKHGIPPIGTVAHEWFMGIAAITDDYENASEIALRYWMSCFGEGTLSIALTDTFGTPRFLEAFKLPILKYTTAIPGEAATQASSAGSTTMATTDSLSRTQPPIQASISFNEKAQPSETRTYAQAFAGVRQDSGDPATFIRMMREFYDAQGITEKKNIVFSDSLNIELCLEYMQEAEDAGFKPTFGVGTFFTNDFISLSTGEKSVPLNIVIKLSSAAGRPAIKISDNIGKNTGDPDTVDRVKQILGYVERKWEGGNEGMRWGKPEDGTK